MKEQQNGSTVQEKDGDGKHQSQAYTQMVKPKKLGQTAGGGKEKSVGKLTGIRKKIDHIKALMRPESKMYRTMLPKTLEFGHEFTCSYTRHGAGGQVKNIFYNKNIRSFVSYNEKQLHVWKATNGQQVMNINFFDETSSHTISTIVYSATHQLYLAISTDFKLHIFNEHLILVGWLPLKVRLVHFAYFYEEKSTLITAGIDGCFMFKINVRSKYEPKQAVLLDPEGSFFHAELGPRIKLEKMPLWIKGLKVNEKQNIIFSWSQLKACFNDLDGKILYRYKKLTTYEDYITDLIVSEKYKYFVTSTFSGSVIVWKLQRKKEMIHSFNAHTKSVTSLQEIPDQPTLFLSASNDNTIRIFSLDKFTELYSFILPAGVTNINLLNQNIFACFYNDQIKIGKLHHLALSFYSSKIEVRQIQKMFKNQEEKENNTAGTVMTLFSDNSVQLQSSDRVDSKMISTIYPPPTAKNVVFLGYCMNLDRIFLMLVSGTICVYRINQAETAILEKMLQSNMIKDSSGKVLNENITSICFCNTIPPKFDVDIYNEQTVTNTKLMNDAYEEQKTKYPSDKTDRFLALGLSKGTVVFLQVDQIDYIYARFSFHRQAISNIVEIQTTGKFVTICEEMNIALWGFKDNRQQVISFNQMYRPVSKIISMKNNLLFAFKPCDTQMFRYDEELLDLVHIKTDSTFEHESEITDLGTFPQKQLFISGSLDGFVKVWNIKKEMIREIKFPEPVYSVSFLNKDGDILVGHLGKVSTVSHKDYCPNEIPKLYKPDASDVASFFQRKKTKADSELYDRLKQKDDELKRQNMIMTKGSKKQLVAKIKMGPHSPEKAGILKNKVKQISSNKKGVTIHDDSSENQEISDYSSDARNDSLEGKSKQSSYQALSGDEDIDTLYQKALNGNQMGTDYKNPRKSRVQLNINDKNNSGSRNGAPQKANTMKSDKNDYLHHQNSDKTAPVGSSKGDANGSFSLDYIDTSIPDTIKESYDVEDMRVRNQLKMKQFTAYQTTAIPKKVTELNYQMAIQRLLHPNRKKEHPTRRDYVIEKIQNNINIFNDPNGDAKLDIALTGQQSRLITIQSENNLNMSMKNGQKHQKITMQMTSDQQSQEALRNLMSVNQSLSYTPAQGIDELEGRKSIILSKEQVANTSIEQYNIATNHTSKFEQSKIESNSQEATARTQNLLRASRESDDRDIINNRHPSIQQNPNTNFISILGQHDSSAAYFEVMRDEPQNHHNVSDIRSSKNNSNLKGHKDEMPYKNQQASQELPRIHSRSGLSGEMLIQNKGKSGRKDGLNSNQHLPFVEGQVERELRQPQYNSLKFNPIRHKSYGLNQIPIVKQLIAKKNQKFQINSTQRQPSHQLFQNFDSTGTRASLGIQNIYPSNYSAIQGTGLALTANRASQSYHQDSIISQGAQVGKYSSLNHTYDAKTAANTISQGSTLNTTKNKYISNTKLEHLNNIANIGSGSPIRLQQQTYYSNQQQHNQGKIQKGSVNQENRLLRNKQTTVAGGLNLSPDPYANRLNMVGQNVIKGPGINQIKNQQKNIEQLNLARKKRSESYGKISQTNNSEQIRKIGGIESKLPNNNQVNEVTSQMRNLPPKKQSYQLIQIGGQADVQIDRKEVQQQNAIVGNGTPDISGKTIVHYKKIDMAKVGGLVVSDIQPRHDLMRSTDTVSSQGLLQPNLSSSNLKQSENKQLAKN